MTPENKAKKEYLLRYKWGVKALKQIDREITQLRLHALPGGISYDGMPHGSGGNGADLANYAAELDKYEMKFKAQRKVILRTLDEILYSIESVENLKSQILLRYLYVELREWGDIADLMGYSEDYVRQELHSNALRDFQIPT